MVIEYVYLLGLYLGDGNIARSGRTYALSVTLDSRYPGIVDAAASAIREVVPHRRVRVRRRGGAVAQRSSKLGGTTGRSSSRSTGPAASTRGGSFSPGGATFSGRRTPRGVSAGG